jgi:hypothetical protein
VFHFTTSLPPPSTAGAAAGGGGGGGRGTKAGKSYNGGRPQTTAQMQSQR